MVYIFGASSVYYALEKNIRERRQLPEVITKSGYNLHPQAKDKLKIVSHQINQLPKSAAVILFHDLINNSRANPKSDPGSPLTAEQLVTEIKESKQKIVGIVFCERAVAPNVYKELSAPGFPTLNVVRDLLSRRKQKDRQLITEYQKFHQNRPLKLKFSLFCHGKRQQLDRNHQETTKSVASPTKNEARASEEVLSKCFTF